MKKILLFCLATFLTTCITHAQVTQINSNKSLHVEVPLSNGKTIVVSDIDGSIWATNGTLAGTTQISPNIKFEESGGLISGKLIFRGSTAATGSEVYSTDGNSVSLVSDIYVGPISSDPGDFTTLNGFVYFSARTAMEGRELWKTNGTSTSILKDIVPGTDSSNNKDEYNLFSNGTYLLFAARTVGSGIELWKSDGSTMGTVLLKEINTGNLNADSSNPREFYALNSVVVFAANDGVHGEEIWRTDGSPGGTSMLKDINTGSDSATYGNVMIAPGFFYPYPVFEGFHTFNNRAYFNADDGTSTGEIWSTDGSAGNATLLKDVVPGTSAPSLSLLDAINLPTKFIFPINGTTTSALWESDGSTANTKVFKSFSANPGDFLYILLPYSFNFTSGTITYPLFHGNQFFFSASTTTAGNELWVSDGTLGGTNMVKDINPGAGSGFSIGGGYVYTTTNLFFAADDGTLGNELWKSDGTTNPAGTSMVADINPAANNSDPELPIFLCNGKVVFSATNGDDPVFTDLYVVNGTFNPLPIQLTDFTVSKVGNDALLKWSTQQEINTKEFNIQRSFDALNFEDVGTIAAAGTSSNRHAYSFTDPGVISSGKSEVYYRIMTSDQDGKRQGSNVVLLKLKANTEWNVRLLENPVKGSVNVLLSGITGNLKLSIKTIDGKAIFTNTFQNVNGQITLPSNLHQGTYILIAENNNERKVIKFIK